MWEVKAGKINPLRGESLVNYRAETTVVDAKLVLVKPGSDEVMGVGVNVGIDAQGDGRHLPHRGGNVDDDVELGLALDVEHPDTELKRAAYLAVGLSDAGKHDVGRLETGGYRLVDLSPADTVGAKSGGGDAPEYLGIVVGLYRIMDTKARVAGRGLDGVERRIEQLEVVVVERCVERCKPLGREECHTF